LNVENLSKGYGGKQRKLHPSLIKQVNGYLGPFNGKLNEGNVQTMVFSSNIVMSNKIATGKYTKEELIQKGDMKHYSSFAKT
jgi:hypothetical protein